MNRRGKAVNWSKLVIIFVVLMLVGGMVAMYYFFNARMTATEYMFQVDAVLAAAEIANGGEPVTEADRAVIAEYGGARTVVVPENYVSLSSYLRKDAMMPFFARIDRDKALKITVCDVATLYACPANDGGDEVLVQLETGGKTFRMHTRGGNLWKSLLACCTAGTYHGENIPLD